MKKIGAFLLLLFSVFLNQTYAQAISNIGLQLWLKGDSGIVLNSSKIVEWKDASGNNNHCLQNDTTFQPILNSNIAQLNNQKTISLDGINDYMTFTNRISDIRSVFFVVKHIGGIVAFEPILGDDLGYDFIGDDFSGALFNPAYTNANILNGNIRINKIQVPTVVNAQKPISYSIISLTTTGNVAASRLTKDRLNASRVWSGEYAEVIIYNRLLDADEISSVEDYLVEKYAPSPDLGPDLFVNQAIGCIPNSPVQISSNPNFASYLWSTSETTSQITVNQFGQYSVICTDYFGIQHFDTIQVLPPPINFNYPNTILCATDSITWNTNISKDNYSFIWQNSSNDSLFVITQAGLYFVSVLDSYGCTYNSDTVSISLDSFAVTTSLGSDTSLCAGNTITLLTGSMPGILFQWNDGSTNDSIPIFSSGLYSLTATNVNNCIAKDTINVTVVGQAPIAGFENSITCENTSVNFTDTSFALGGGTIINWFWNFGDATATNDTSIISQPNYTFTDTGSYTINLTVTTNVGCKQNLTKNIYIYPKPNVDFINVIACQNDTAFFNEAINPLGYLISNYQWDFGDGATSTSSDPFHIFSQNINYQVQLIATNSQGCVDTAIKTITVKDEVSADFNYSTACINVPISFTDNSIAPLPNTTSIRNWSFFPGTATGLNATKTFTSSGSHPVTLTVNGSNGCISSITKSIFVSLPPVADFTSSTICIADSFQLTDASLPINGNINSWQWKFAGNTFSIAQNPKYLLNSSGNASVFLKVTNDSGCVDSITKIIFVNPLPDASFDINPSTYLFIDSPVSFTPNQASASSYFWNLNNGNTFSDPILTLSFTNEDTYTLGLLLTDNFGCKNNSSQTFTIARRMTDLGIIAARSTIDNDGFVGVEADLFNYGSTPITEFEILYELTGGGIMKESWEADTLPPGAVLLFKFSAKSFLSINERENAISCITIQTVNTSIDDNLTNNENCAALNSNKQLVAEPFPNPADGDVSLPVVLTEDQTITITVYDYLGKLIAENITYDGVTGLNFIKIPCAAYSSGTYTLKISISDNNYIRKLIKQGSTK